MASGKPSDDIKAENEQETAVNINSFSNDGSFLQVYKQKLQEMELEKKRKEEKAKKKNENQLKRLNHLQVETIIALAASIIIVPHSSVISTDIASPMPNLSG